jgi:hypothetical protein
LYISGLLLTAPGTSFIGPSSTPSNSVIGPSSTPIPYKRKLAIKDTKPSRGSGTTTKKCRKPKVIIISKSKPTLTPTLVVYRANPSKGKVSIALSKIIIS